MTAIFKSKIFLIILLGVIALLVLFYVVMPALSTITGRQFSFAAVGLSHEGGSTIIRSFDRGETWKVVFPREEDLRMPRSAKITDVEFHPALKSQLFVATEKDGLWMTPDLGNRWELVADSTGFLTRDSRVQAISISRTAPGAIYVSLFGDSENVVARSFDEGRTFAEIYRAPKAGGVIRVVAVDPVEAAHIFLGASDGALIETRDSGETWRVVHRFENSVRGIFLERAGAKRFLVYLADGVLEETHDSGLTWRALSLSEDSATGAIMSIPQPDDEPVRVPNFFRNPFRAADTFADVSTDPRDIQTITVRTPGGIKRSFDAGVTWEHIETIVQGERTTGGTAATPTGEPSTVYFGLDTDFYRSDDSGKTWRKVVLPADIRKIVTHHTDPDVLFGILK